MEGGRSPMVDGVILLHSILLLPLLSAGVLCRLPRHARRFNTTLAVGTSLVFFGLILSALCWHQNIVWQVPWWHLSDLKVAFGYAFNAQSATLLFALGWVGLWVFVFSIGYLKEDKEHTRYFANLLFFLFAMTGVILAGNLWMLFVFWELVGLGSYLLIAHYRVKKEAILASKKAFIVNRIGDVGLLVGIILAWDYYGTVDLSAIESLITSGEKEVSVWIGLCLIGGFLGKSAQFPLHIWLPDAMAGPTPVSALIHAATMVACGVYLLVRTFFMLDTIVLEVILCVSLWMCLWGGLMALRQYDIKRVLAYSTLSHLGLMGCAVALGFPSLALLHLLLHAFFKGGLFLGAGAVIHATGGIQDIRQLGGLWRKMPISCLSFVVASLSLAGIPLFAGYYSKHALLEGAFTRGTDSHTFGSFVPYGILVVASFLTALYIGRLLGWVFGGNSRSEGATKATEVGWQMCVPVLVLGCLYGLGSGWFLWGEKMSWWGGKMLGLTPAFAVEGLSEQYKATLELATTSVWWDMTLSICIIGLLGIAFLRGVACKEWRGIHRIPVWDVFDRAFLLGVKKIWRPLVVGVFFLFEHLLVMLLLLPPLLLFVISNALRLNHCGSARTYIAVFTLGLLGALSLLFVR